jgi:Pvc16 N-terminal domain
MAGGGGGTPLVNVYLYQVTPNAAYRNADLPTRRSNATLVSRPQTALDLHYLFTFHGNDDQLEPQRLLGAVATTLHAQPLLSRSAIVKALGDYGFLASSNLADQVERVRFTPTSLSLEEFSKLWSVFFQIEYTLSAAYQASVVLLESDDVPGDAPPVQARNVYVVPFRWPSIDRVIPATGPSQPIVSSSTLLIQGQQLRGEITTVLIEGVERPPTDVQDTQITLPLPPNVRAGVQGLQVIQKLFMGTPLASHRGFESNVAPFVLRPTITATTSAVAPSPPGGADVTLTLTPNIGIGQRAVLLLNNLALSPPTAFTSLPAVSKVNSSQVTINIGDVPTGTYLARVQIDGAESLLTTNASGQFIGPTVNMP